MVENNLESIRLNIIKEIDEYVKQLDGYLCVRYELYDGIKQIVNRNFGVDVDNVVMDDG